MGSLLISYDNFMSYSVIKFLQTKLNVSKIVSDEFR